jgi:exosortase F-associated protein
MNVLLIASGIAGVMCTYLLQDMEFAAALGLSERAEFVVRKAFRVALNDLFMLVLVGAWFRDKSVTRLAILIQLIDGLILLPIYLVVKLHFEGASEVSMPLLSQFHRIIVNPTLMLLLIPAVYFQRAKQKRS